MQRLFSLSLRRRLWLVVCLTAVPPFGLIIYSIVVIWGGHRGSYKDHAPLLGKYLRKDTVNRGTAGQLVMDEHQELLQQCTPLLPTGVPNGLDETLRPIRSSRQTRQVQQRRGHEDQTPMFPNGFGAPHAILVEAQVPLTVLIKRFDGMISNDKFCCTRWGALQLSWWRRPNRLRR